MNTAVIKKPTPTSEHFTIVTSTRLNLAKEGEDSGQVLDAVQGYVHALKSLGKSRVNSIAVAKALGLTEKQALTALRQLELAPSVRR